MPLCVCVQEPDHETGDIIIVLDEQPHEVYKRKGSDLLINMVRGHVTNRGRGQCVSASLPSAHRALRSSVWIS